jgi:hypothetical protein
MHFSPPVSLELTLEALPTAQANALLSDIGVVDERIKAGVQSCSP